MENKWTSVKDRLPDCRGKFYMAKIIRGPITPKNIVREVLFSGWIFMVEDWEIVTHWKEVPAEKEKKDV